MNYAKGLITKDKIIEVCKKLFYEKGLESTTYKDICRMANVHPGTLTHHFNGKYNIASDVYLKSMHRLDDEIKIKFPFEDSLQHLLISIYAQMYVMYKDSGYRRFKIEYSTADIHYGSYLKHLPRIFNEVFGDETYQESKASEASMFRAVAYRGMQAAMSYYIGERLNEIPIDTAFCYWVNLMLSMHGKSKGEIETRISKTLHLLKTIEIIWDKLTVSIKIKEYY